ncbi:MAG: hypothetical protein AB7F41_01280 [Methylocystis sp.]|uniref:hypothetical protein n=1 Tax=Methylocystis sp. TaxID=1911079 RepID=UPI003D09C715
MHRLVFFHVGARSAPYARADASRPGFTRLARVASDIPEARTLFPEFHIAQHSPRSTGPAVDSGVKNWSFGALSAFSILAHGRSQKRPGARGRIVTRWFRKKSRAPAPAA